MATQIPTIMRVEQSQKPSAESSTACEIARTLLDSYYETMAASIAAQEAQFRAIVSGEDGSRYETLVEEANQRRENAKYTYLSHTQSHGCFGLSSNKNGLITPNSSSVHCP